MGVNVLRFGKTVVLCQVLKQGIWFVKRTVNSNQSTHEKTTKIMC